jgi:hypothetical protein
MTNTNNITYMHTSDNINLIQHYLLNVNNSFLLQFSNNIKMGFSKELTFILITKNTELEHLFHNIALTARSPPLREV